MAISVLCGEPFVSGRALRLRQEVGKRWTGPADTAVGIHEERLAGMDLPDQDPHYQDHRPQAPHRFIIGKM